MQKLEVVSKQQFLLYHPADYTQTQQHTEADLPQLWTVREGYEKGQHPLWGLLAADGSDIRKKPMDFSMGF